MRYHPASRAASYVVRTKHPRLATTGEAAPLFMEARDGIAMRTGEVRPRSQVRLPRPRRRESVRERRWVAAPGGSGFSVPASRWCSWSPR